MARKRIIDPSFWIDEEIGKISPEARLLYIGLWGICDDNYATFPNKLGELKIQIFPYDNVKVDKLLKELADIGKILPFKDRDGQDYWYLKNLLKWQKIDRPSSPKYPKYRSLDDGSTSTRPELKKELINKSEKFIKNSRDELTKKWGKHRI